MTILIQCTPEYERMVITLPITPVSPKQIDWIPFLDTCKQIFSPARLHELAVQHGFTKRNRKIKPEDFITLCALSNKETGINSLGQLCARFYEFTHIHVTEEALNQRFNQQAVHFLKDIFQSLLQNQLSEPLSDSEHLPFTRIRILDSTGFKTPTDCPDRAYQGCGQPALKIQLEYELKHRQFLHLDLRNGKEHDSLYADSLIVTVKPGDLLLRDLGYFSLDELQSIQEFGGFYISRVKHNVTLYLTKEKSEQPKCAEDFMKDLQPGEMLELQDVYLSHKRIHQPRLILYRLTAQQEEAREEKWNQRRKKMKRERLDCHLYGTLICILLSSSMTFKMRQILYQKEKRELSEYKTMYMVREAFVPMLLGLFEPNGNTVSFLDGLYELIRKNGKKSKRFKKRSPLDILKSLPF
jgi:hypothetical protein